MAVSVLSVNVVCVLFTNLAVLLKRCFTRIKRGLCEQIGCAGEESVVLHRQICTVKHPQLLIAVNSKYVKSNSTKVHVRMCRSFVFDAVDLFKPQVSNHTLVLTTFNFVIYRYNIYILWRC